MSKREIEFRGQRVDNKKWVYGSLSVEYDGTCVIMFWVSELIEPENNYKEMVQKSYEVIPETVGQFTGLIDKNVNRIFEGDKDKSGLFVKYNQLHCCYGLFSESGYQKDIMADWCDKKGNTPKEWVCSDIEIIGNIYE